MSREEAEYEIRIYNPKKAKDSPRAGHARHDVRIKESGKWRGMTKSEINLYNIDRIVTNKEDMSFEKDTFAPSKFIYIMQKSSDWFFADPPFKIKENNFERIEIERISSNVATIKVSEGNKDSVLKYAIHYQNESGETLIHDPIIRNGSIPPSLASIRENLIPFLSKNDLIDEE